MGLPEIAGLIGAITITLKVVDKLADALINKARNAGGHPSTGELLALAADKLATVAEKLNRLCDLQSDIREDLRKHAEKTDSGFESIHRRLDRRAT